MNVGDAKGPDYQTSTRGAPRHQPFQNQRLVAFAASPTARSALVRLLIGLALDAQRRHRASLEAIDAYRTAAALAHAVAAVHDATHGLLDLGEEHALAVANPQFSIAVGLEECAVGRVGERGPGIHHLADGTLGVGEQVGSLFVEQALEGLELASVHVRNLTMRPITAESAL
jgi:hypothetical protein